jgi:hypothetical protein
MIAIAIIGLLFPGYMIARALRAPFGWAAAFPLSALAIVETVIALSHFNVAICIWTGTAALAVVTVIALAIARLRGTVTSEPPAEPMTRTQMWLLALVAAHVSFVLLALIARCSLYPLSGADTIYRWDALARMLLAEGSFAHYPPLADADFTSYVYPDAIPPLVASVYWWLYAAWGAAEPAITTIAIALQALSCFCLVYCAARTNFGASGGIVALVAIASAPLFISSLAIGQESGYLAIAYAGQLAFTLAARKDPQPRYAVMAALFAAIGALARDYGPVLSLCGLFILAAGRDTRRLLPIFCVVLVLVAGPWYLRTWQLTGNPLYPNDVLHLGLSTNPVHVGLHEMYSEVVGPGACSAAEWRQFFARAIFQAPLAMVLGALGLWIGGRKTAIFIPPLVVVLWLWFWSIGFTLGGLLQTGRMWAPIYVTLSVAAGACGPALVRILQGPSLRVRLAVFTPIILCAAFTQVALWAFVLASAESRGMVLTGDNNPQDAFQGRRLTAQVVRSMNLPDAGVLTDDSYLAVALAREHVRAVTIWSPQAAFVFDPKLSPSEVRRRLREQNILFVAPFRGNLPYLRRFPFYSEDSAHWQQVRYEGQELSLFFLPP